MILKRWSSGQKKGNCGSPQLTSVNDNGSEIHEYIFLDR